MARLTASSVDFGTTLRSIAALLRRRYGYRMVSVFVVRGDRLTLRAGDGVPAGLPDLGLDTGLMGAAVRSRRAVFAADVRDDPRYVPALPDVLAEIAVPVIVGDEVWGVVNVEDDRLGMLTAEDTDLISTISQQVAVAALNVRLLDRVGRQARQADALRRIAADISGNLDLDAVLRDLIDHGTAFFGADRAGVFLLGPNRQTTALVSRGLSQAYLDAVRDFPMPSLGATVVAERKPAFAVDYRNDARGASIRHAVIQEGFDTVAMAPLLGDDEVIGVLALYHDRPRPYDDEELEAFAALAAQASVAIRNAQNYAQMATWAAQLQSIQLLGARLSRLTSVKEIGHAIAAELNRLIDYHNVRVYRVEGETVEPVAWRGQIGEYLEETEEQLRLKVGQGITGWVAQHGIAQNLPDAARDPRARAIPGTEDDLPESLLVAPMTYEDRVIGVIVLSKLGLNQFRDDHLRLLVIYASLAAQAMANADATGRLRAQSETLERQVRSQGELLRITESILTTLDARAVLDQVTDRLAAVVGYDNIAIELIDRATGRLRPFSARGVHADEYLKEWEPDEITALVIRHGEAQLVKDELADPRVAQFESTGPVAGSLIVAPLRGRDGVTGVLTLERLGTEDRFTEEEFELVKLFAAHASIALQNADVYQAVEIRAQTDGLTGLKNHATFQEMLVRAVTRGDPFSLIMLDLDEFKGYNDAHGHQAGDRLLRAIAEALVRAGRESDQVFRYGGDEFTLILPATDAHGAQAVARKATSAIEETSRRVARGTRSQHVVTASIGVATYPDDGTDRESIVLAADRACFVAKRGGRAGIATADDGRALAGEFTLTAPTPVDEVAPAGRASGEGRRRGTPAGSAPKA